MYKIYCPIKECERNKKPIEGYNKEHAESLLKQHMLKHENERRKEDAKNKKSK